MTEKDFGFDLYDRGQALQPPFVAIFQLRVRCPVRCAHIFERPVDKLAVMIAPDVEPGLAQERIGGGRGLQWAGQVIPEVHHEVWRLLLQVRPNGIERLQVSMYVGDNGDSQIFT